MATATLVSKNGGRPIAWICGIPQGFSKQYVFPAGKPLEIEEVDAAALRAGKIDCGTRVFEVSPAPAAAMAPRPTTDPDLGDGPAPRMAPGGRA